MSYVNSITAKGQVTIPKEFRQKLGLDKTRKAMFSLNESGEVVVSRPKTLEEVRALLREPTGRDPLSAKEALIGKALAKKYGVR